MDVFTSAAELLRDRRPERPVLALRPHAARRAANWFIANFPGRVLYAAKANDAPEIIEALVEAGIRGFDVASLVEIERLAAVEGSELFFMNPVKSRGAIVRAYRDYGVRSFAFDSDDELDKIVQETGGAGGPRPLSQGRLPEHAQPHPARGQVRRLGGSGAGASAPRPAARAAARHHLPCRLAGRRPGRVRRGAPPDRPADRHLRRHGRCHRHRRRLSEPLSALRPARACELHGRGGAGGGRACRQAFLRADVRARPRAGGRGRIGDRAGRCAPRPRALCQ